MFVYSPDSDNCEITLSSDHSEITFSDPTGAWMYESGYLMYYTPTTSQISSAGEYELSLRVSITSYNYLFWTFPVYIKVSCDFVSDDSCAHEYLPALDPSYSRITICEDDASFQLDFATTA